jgi:hypothetical protein
VENRVDLRDRVLPHAHPERVEDRVFTQPDRRAALEPSGTDRDQDEQQDPTGPAIRSQRLVMAAPPPGGSEERVS